MKPFSGLRAGDTMRTLVIWDMDGTLTESKPWIIASYRYAARMSGLPEPSEEVLSTMMCGGLFGHIEQIFGKTGPEAEEIARYYRDYYIRECAPKVQLFPGILEVLRGLNEKCVDQAVATMKLQDAAEAVLERLGISKYFKLVRGDSPEGDVTKTQMIKDCVTSGDYGRVFMIGDCPGDGKAAKEAGVPFIAALFGYGYTKERCRSEGIAYAEVPEDIPGLVGP